MKVSKQLGKASHTMAQFPHMASISCVTIGIKQEKELSVTVSSRPEVKSRIMRYENGRYMPQLVSVKFGDDVSFDILYETNFRLYLAIKKMDLYIWYPI